MKRVPLTLFLFSWELDSIPAYSTTLPTATTLGKFWRRNLNVFTPGAEPEWQVCAYSEHEDPRSVTIIKFEVVLRSGPLHRYSPPDWTNIEQWRRERDAARAAAEVKLRAHEKRLSVDQCCAWTYSCFMRAVVNRRLNPEDNALPEYRPVCELHRAHNDGCIYCMSEPTLSTPCPCMHAPCVHDANRERAARRA